MEIKLLINLQGSSFWIRCSEQYYSVSWSSARAVIKDWTRSLQTSYWGDLPGLRQAKELVRPYDYKDITALNKADLRLLVGYLTGYHGLRYHPHKIGLSQETDCRLCLEDDETTTHILTRLRRRFFQQELLRPMDIKSSSVKDFFAFIRIAEGLLQ